MSKLVLIVITLFSLSLFALSEGRIKNNGVPSLITVASVESSSMSYVAPVMDYTALSFGFVSYQYFFNGIQFGTHFQWIDSSFLNATLSASIYSMSDRSADQFLIGGVVNATVVTGGKKSGFLLKSEGELISLSHSDSYTTAALYAGAYMFPVENCFVLQILPGVGRRIGFDDAFYFNLIFSLEAYFWK